MTLIYMDRLVKRLPYIKIGLLTCHRLVLTCMVVAIKFNDDTFNSNAFYAKVGGINLLELNNLEKTLLTALDFKLCVSPQEFELYRSIVLQAARMP